ncbi:MAG: DUF58 domain-containing protein [Victivallales bacterium]|nr:DUF58 domain-containing protein [Victivallales bacterium]
MTTAPQYCYLPPKTLESLKNIELVARNLAESGLLGLHRSPYRGFSAEFAEYRKYTPGDGIRYLDWKVYARSDRFYVKCFEEETNLRTYIVLDQSGSMGMPDLDVPMKFNYACYLAAAFMYLMYRQHDGVGFFSYNDQVRETADCRCTRSHLIDLLRRLENLHPEGQSAAGSCLRRIAGQIPKRSLVLIFSDFFDAEPDFLDALQLLAFKHCEMILFQVLNENERHFPYRGLVEFEDLETGATMALEAESCREYFLHSLRNYNRRIKDFCDAGEITFFPLTTATPFERALAAYFAKREAMF